MSPKIQRALTRLAGFAAGVPVGLVLYRPWQERQGPHWLADWIMVLVAGFIGVAVFEFARRFVPGQRQLDADEIDSLSDADVERLLKVRRYVRVGAMVLGFLFPFFVFGVADAASHALLVIVLCLYYALVMWLFAEILLSLHPRQRILRAVLRRQRSR